MHHDAFLIDDALVRSLIHHQFPAYSKLELKRFASDGTDNVIYRLGAEMCVRLPLVPSATAMLTKEISCIARLPELPLQIPQPVAVGRPVDDYPSAWGVYRWIEGEAVTGYVFPDDRKVAESLAAFVGVLQRSDASDAPRYGRHNNYRGCPLIERDQPTRTAIDGVSDLFSAEALVAAWDMSLTIPAWGNDPVWVHGDIHSGNLLMRDGQINAVIDFGLMGAGDPAVDLIVNWSLLSAQARARFRNVLAGDDDTWRRGRGWALSTALVALAYYRNSNQFLAEMSKRVISEVLTDFETST